LAVNEESEDKAVPAPESGDRQHVALSGIYLIVSAAAQAYGGPQLLIDNSGDVLSVLGGKVFPSPIDKP